MKPTTINHATVAAQRTAANHARHAVQTPAVIHLYAVAGFDPNSPADVASLYTNANAIYNKTVSLLYSQNGTPMLYDLMMQTGRDHAAASIANYTATADNLHAEADHLREVQHALKQYTQRVTITDSERTTAAQEAERMKNDADRIRGNAQDIEQTGHIEYSDRMDGVQDTAVALLLHGIKEARKAARHSISNNAHPDALAGSRTDVWTLDSAPAVYRNAAKAADLINTPNDSNGNPRKVDAITIRGKRDGFITYEHRNTKTRQGWYLIHHRYTQQPYTYYQQYDEEGAILGLTTNGGINAIIDQSSAQAFVEALKTANLSERQQRIVCMMLDNTAKRYARESLKAEAQQRKASNLPELTKDQRTAHYTAFLWESAMVRNGIYAKPRQADVKRDIREKLRKAYRTTIQHLLTADHIHDERSAAEAIRMQITTSSSSKQPDLIAAMSAATAQTADHAPVIKWKRSPYAGYVRTLTTEEREAEEAQRRAEASAHYAQHAHDIAYCGLYRKTRDTAPTTTAVVMEYTRSERTPATIRSERKANSAAYSAWAFVCLMDEEDKRTYATAERERIKAAQAWREKLAAEKAAAQAAEKAQHMHPILRPLTPEQQQQQAERMEDIRAWLEAQSQRKAEEAAAQQERSKRSKRKLAAYNAAITAAFASMGTTYANATEEQRSSARAAAEKAYSAAE